MAQIGLTIPAFLFLLVGWTLFFISGGFMFILSRWTPAFTFFKAWLKGLPVAWVRYRHGIGEFKTGVSKYPGCMDVAKLGSVLMTEGSQVFERKSKVPVYEVFAEYGAALPKEYEPILVELRKHGFNISNFEEYNQLVLLSRDKVYVENFLSELKTKEEKNDWKKKIDVLKGLKLEVKTYAAYNVRDLADFFPNNINPTWIEALKTNAVMMAQKRNKMNMQLLIVAAIAFAIIVGALLIFLKVYHQPAPQVIVQTIETGVQLANGSVTV